MLGGMKTVRAGTQIRSVSRAARLLLYLAQREDGSSATEAAAALGLPVPTAHHLLNTLVAEGLIAKDGQRRYYLGPKIGVLSDAFLHQMTPPDYLLAPLRDLAERTGETAYLSGWRRGEIVVLATVEGNHAVRVSGLHSGFPGAAHARASGKLLLAFARTEERDGYLQRHPLEPRTRSTIVDKEELLAEFGRIRKRGYAVDEEEFTEGVACVAAPVVESGIVVAAYTVSAPLERFRQRRQTLVESVLESARAASLDGVPQQAITSGRT